MKNYFARNRTAKGDATNFFILNYIIYPWRGGLGGA